MMNNIFEWETIQTKRSRTGIQKTVCPVCSHDRKKKNDPCLYVNFNSGVAKCYNCDSLSFDPEKSLKTSVNAKKEYSPIIQEWKNYTNLSDGLVKWFRDVRKISQNTLSQFGITEEKHFQPAQSKEMNNTVFNYFEGEKLVNKKYRSGTKDFTQTKGGKPILYNINSVIGQEEVYICEGEIDVLSLYEIGIYNAVSLPNGANDNDEYWINSEQYLSDVKNFIICTDNDEKGILIREKIAQRLGRFRCTYIEFENKDANGDLQEGKLAQNIKKRNRFNIGGTFTSFDMLDDILRLYSSGVPKTISPKKSVFGNLHEKFSIMLGQLTTITGIPSHGKSSFVDWYVLNLVHEFEMKASIFSPEHSPLELFMSKHIRLAIGKPFFGKDKVSENDIFRFVEWSKEKLYYTTQEQSKTPDWDWLMEKMKDQMFTYGINFFVIDAWNKVQMPKGLSGKDGIDQTLTRLTSFCQTYNVHIFLIAHPTKMKKLEKTGKYEMPTLYDVSGSADFKNQTHNGFTIYREFADENSEGFTTFSVQKIKFDFQGEIGCDFKFNYHLPTGRYYVDGSNPANFDLTIQQVVTDEEINFNSEFEPPTKLNPNLGFDLELIEDVPF